MAAPKLVGGYEVVDRLAVGGMAEIYIARARGINGFEKHYVLKLIHPKHSGDHEFIRMLVDEAKLTAQLHHVNIVQVIGLGTHEDQYFIVMEYVRGKDLYQILNQAYDKRIPVPLDVCAFIAKEACAGLYFAHTLHDEDGRQLSLVHRDVSPQNILISWKGEVKVADFGVAKAAIAARPETQAGVIKGKFRYMSPEQAWGEKLDGRSDIFAMGLCLYELITSSMAYEDDPDMRKMLTRMREAKFQPATALRADLDPTFDEIVMKALQRRKQDRYEDAHDFEIALTTYLYGRTPSFTRARVAAFMARLFPDEAPISAEMLAPKNVEPSTRPLSLQQMPTPAMPLRPSVDSTTDEVSESDLMDDNDSEEHTIRKSILGVKLSPAPAELPDPQQTDEFDGATELFGHNIDAEATTAMPAPNRPKLPVAPLAQPIAYQPQPIPTSWIPREVPESFPQRHSPLPSAFPVRNVEPTGVQGLVKHLNAAMAHPQQRWVVMGLMGTLLVTVLIIFVFLLFG